MSIQKELIYPAFERFWHWTQAALIFFLALTGFEIHGSLSFFGFEQAVQYHTTAAYSLIVLIVFAIDWHLTTGEWRNYIPTVSHVRAYLNYYLFGIFRREPHPTKKTVLSKLNPLQKLVYFGLKTVIIPVIVVSGLLYIFYRYPDSSSIAAINVATLEIIAVAHTAAAFILLAFVIAHLYLITTGDTIFGNLKAMLTGYEEKNEGRPTAEMPEAREGSESSVESESQMREEK